VVWACASMIVLFDLGSEVKPLSQLCLICVRPLRRANAVQRALRFGNVSVMQMMLYCDSLTHLSS
jgi:hypothetical protein